MITNTEILSEFLGYDEKDLEFEKVVNNLDKYDVEHGIEVIFNHYRKHGFHTKEE